MKKITMNKKALNSLSAWDLSKLEKYIRAFIGKVPQVIVQSRCGEKKHATDSNLCNCDVYEIAIEDNPDIQAKTNVACSSINPLKEFCLSIEILLKTADGDTLVLEAWSLQMEHSEKFWDSKYQVYAEPEIVFGNLMRLMKSLIIVTRTIPAFKLSLRQSADTYVMLYRIYPEEPQVNQLGEKPPRNKIGEVFTPVGTISVSVIYRSKKEMTIPPQKTEKGNSFIVKSDYFNFDMSPNKQCHGIKMFKNIINQNSSNIQNVGAFALCSQLPDVITPELALLDKPILNLSRGNLKMCNNGNGHPDLKKDINLNFLGDSWHINEEEWNESEKICDKLSCSDVSDCNDFVVIDLKPPFASYDSDNDLGAFFQECQCAPQLSSLSGQSTLEEQVLDATNQLEKFELSMSDFDSFVESVCQGDIKN